MTSTYVGLSIKATITKIKNENDVRIELILILKALSKFGC